MNHLGTDSVIPLPTLTHTREVVDPSRVFCRVAVPSSWDSVQSGLLVTLWIRALPLLILFAWLWSQCEKWALAFRSPVTFYRPLVPFLSTWICRYTWLIARWYHSMFKQPLFNLITRYNLIFPRELAAFHFRFSSRVLKQGFCERYCLFAGLL